MKQPKNIKMNLNQGQSHICPYQIPYFIIGEGKNKENSLSMKTTKFQTLYKSEKV